MPRFAHAFAFSTSYTKSLWRRANLHHSLIEDLASSCFRSLQNEGLRYSSKAVASKNHQPAVSGPDPSSTSIVVNLPRLPSQRKPRDDNIKVESLEDTIRAHRDANFAKKVRKYTIQEPEGIPRGVFYWRRFKDLGSKEPYTAATDAKQDESQRKLSASARKRRMRGPLSHIALEEQKLPKQYLKMIQRDHGCSSQERLNSEIRAFGDYLRPTRTEEAAVTHCIERFTSVALRAIPHAHLILHGSRVTGLAGPLSDVDFNIQLPASKGTAKEISSSTHPHHLKSGLSILRRFEQALRADACYRDVLLMNATRLPVLEALDRRTGLMIQCVSRPLGQGDEYCKYYIQEYPQLRPLHALLSQSLRNAELYSRSHGNIGSYALFVMILTALTHAREHFQNKELGPQLFHVLGFWADADLLSNGYAADPPRVFPKYSRSVTNRPEEEPLANGESSMAGIRTLVLKNLQEYKAVSKPLYRLCLQDPANHFNDLGRSAYQIRNLQTNFRKALDDIYALAQAWDGRSLKERSEFPFQMCLLRPLVGSNWQPFVVARERLQRASPKWM